MAKIERLLAFRICKADGERGELREGGRKISIPNLLIISSQKWEVGRQICSVDVTEYLIGSGDPKPESDSRPFSQTRTRPTLASKV